MYYINAQALIRKCVENNVFNMYEGDILVYRDASKNNKEGWYRTKEDDLVYELMKSEEGQEVLIEALKKKGIEFKPVKEEF